MRGRVLMKKFYSTEASMIMRVLIYNLFVLFRNEVLGVEERSRRLQTLRYKYFALIKNFLYTSMLSRPWFFE